MINKREFFSYMSSLYDEEYNDDDTYKTLKSIMRTTDNTKVKELRELILMNKKERLIYRQALASNGKELTPRQLDQYISMIEYAISNMEP